MRKWIISLSALGLIVSSHASLAAPCRDAHGKFVKCTKVRVAKPTRCRGSKGKFVKCSVKGAKPV